jgi:hypothetical protein
MEHDLTLPSPETAAPSSDDLNLGTWLGRHQAFGVMAGKAAAADVDCLRHVRDTRLYKSLVPTWDDFCAQYLGSSRTRVNAMIQQLDKYGPQFFALTQLTRVPPAAFDAIAPHLSEQGLTLDGETFALCAENSTRIAAAVTELRQRAEAQNPAPPNKPFEVLEKNFHDLIRRFETHIPALAASEKIKVGDLLTQLLKRAKAAGFQIHQN